jgi:hypothetical protein
MLRPAAFVIAVLAAGALGVPAADAQTIGSGGSLAVPGYRPMSAYDASVVVLTPQDAVPGLELGTAGYVWLRDGMPQSQMTYIPGSHWYRNLGGCSVRDYYIC